MQERRRLDPGRAGGADVLERELEALAGVGDVVDDEDVLSRDRAREPLAQRGGPVERRGDPPVLGPDRDEALHAQPVGEHPRRDPPAAGEPDQRVGDMAG